MASSQARALDTDEEKFFLQVEFMIYAGLVKSNNSSKYHLQISTHLVIPLQVEER